MSDPARWSTPASVAAAARRRWDDGTLLRAFATGKPFLAIEVPLRGPSAGDLGDHFDAAREWSSTLRHASRGGRAYTLVNGRIGGRLTGSTEVPVRAMVDSFEQAWLLLGTGGDASALRQLVDTSEHVPRGREWALASPLAAVALAREWPAVLSAYTWLDSNRGSGRYLRQVSAPGVDTKFIERHRSALGSMLGVSTGAGAFARELGLASKPATVRLRFDPVVLQAPSGLSEAMLRTEELGSLDVRPRRALIIENEITYLSVPVPPGCVVLWGKGYDADQPASLQWLSDIDVVYWGDIDTHGFAILNRVRAHLPTARSALMDRETLLAHESSWGHESAPTDIGLARLDTAEHALYSDIVTDRYGPAVRLEQERIDWGWALERLQ